MRMLRAAICAVTIGSIVVPGAAAKKVREYVGGAVSLRVTPTTITTTTTAVTVSGNVTASGNVLVASNCRNGRTVRFSYVSGTTGAHSTLGETATTGLNGDYTATLPKPADANPPTSSITLQATVDAAVRSVVGGKKKRHRLICGELSGHSGPLTIAPL